MTFRSWFNGRSHAAHSVGVWQLWREFLPLSLSDVTMAIGDPLTTTTLAHLPDARLNLAGVGIAKSLAIFFESPIIMILHASNALASERASRLALWRFVLLLGGGLSLLLMGLSIGFSAVAPVLGIPPTLVPIVQQVLLLMGLWPGAIAWRRYFQGLLIHRGQAQAVAQASLLRLATVAIVLGLGLAGRAPGAIVAGLSLVLGVIVEAIAVTLMARPYTALDPSELDQIPLDSSSVPDITLPQTLSGITRFYWPLANSMVVVWGGRALLLGVIARASDSALALAAWPSAWGVILVIANSTRMVQQIVIKYRGKATDRLLVRFTLMVGVSCSLLLVLMSTTPIGDTIIQTFIGDDQELRQQIQPVLIRCTAIPLLVALQNATQGFLVSDGRTGRVNLSTWLGTLTLLTIAIAMVYLGQPGALAAATAMVAAMAIEVLCLAWQYRLATSARSGLRNGH
jgi:progressive ankylosis protein